MRALLAGFKDSALFPIVAVAAFTGARRNEILALRWSDLDAANKTLRIERSMEETKAGGRRLKEPKTRRGTRSIQIDDDLFALLLAEREKYLRIKAGVPERAAVDLSLVKLPLDALIFPSPTGSGFDFTRLRDAHAVTRQFVRRARKLGFPGLRFHDLRGTHETLLLDAGVPVHVVAARCGQTLPCCSEPMPSARARPTRARLQSLVACRGGYSAHEKTHWVQIGSNVLLLTF